MNTTVMTQVKTMARRIKIARWIGGITGGTILLVATLVGYMAWGMNNVPTNLDYATTQLTENGLYQVSYKASQAPIPINQLHTWTLTLATPDGQPVGDARITVDGDMPQHGHGLPTQPQVTQSLGGGKYLLEGVKFQMGGWWVVDFNVTAGGITDQVRFNLLLK